jgi:hypothetical protein
MGRQKLALCVFQVRSEEDRWHSALVPAQGKCKIRIPPEGPGIVKTVSAGIIEMDPTGRDLVNRIVNGLETVFGQTIGDPFIKIFAGTISGNPELTDADGVEKNTHNPPPHVTKDSIEIFPDLVQLILWYLF